MAKKRNRQCPKCNWKAKTTAKVCPRCSSVLSEKRQPNGQAKRIVDNDKGTPELREKREAGVRDEMADQLHATKQISDQQLEAFRVYERARRIYIGSPNAKTASLAEMIPGGKGELSDGAIINARRAYWGGREALESCGSRSAFSQVQDLICNEAPYDLHGLLIGLDALVSIYRMGEGKAA